MPPAKRGKVTTALQSLPSAPTSRTSSAESRDFLRRIGWDIDSINVHLCELRRHTARELGITGPQWMILMALEDLDNGDGVPVHVVSNRLGVNGSFVTTQSKLLEKRGFIRRKRSTSDARVVQMSLSTKTTKQLATLSTQQDTIEQFVVGDFDDRELSEFASKLSMLKDRLKNACLKVSLDL
ncbi:MarR family winged helix-turn-helix transcriptional regulator [Bradyrhizobium niftali]|jgi:MarR family transcriptional regulator, organic hydroperoxide resistance regulator|uniref:MarR family transcriptional regulator n=1 Tax=Bradyrhizobium niftali TaxID=2560055 RepID=A0A4Y9LZG1_9BRAD|nr:MarR family transcriptional regulator [Bradyrhizobium niftali]TFV48217.1 MarR family transcriptional regulator [Bradyrhizobium niftali]